MAAERTVVVTSADGLHARPAVCFVQAAAQFSSQVDLSANGKTVSAKSLVGVLRLGVRSGESLSIRATGSDEERAVAELGDLIAGPSSGSAR